MEDVLGLPFIGSGKNSNDRNTSVNAGDVTDMNVEMNEMIIQLNV